MNWKWIILDYTEDIGDNYNYYSPFDKYALWAHIEPEWSSSEPYVSPESYRFVWAWEWIFPWALYYPTKNKKEVHSYDISEKYDETDPILSIQNEIWKIESEIFFLENVENLSVNEHHYYQNIKFKEEKRKELDNKIKEINEKILKITNQIQNNKNWAKNNTEHQQLLTKIEILKKDKRFFKFIKNNLFKNVHIDKKLNFSDKDKIKIDNFIDYKLDILYKKLEKLEKLEKILFKQETKKKVDLIINN
jgi:hypothetical protein